MSQGQRLFETLTLCGVPAQLVFESDSWRLCGSVKFLSAGFMAVWRRHLRLIQILILCILGVAGLLGALGLRSFQRREFTEIMRHKVEVTASGFDRFFGPIVSNFDFLADLGRYGFLDLDERNRLDRLLQALMTNHIPDVNQVVIASTEGRIHEYPLAAEITDSNNVASSDLQTPTDVGQRRWYKGAMETKTPEQVYWTPPYTFSTGVPGITGSRRYYVQGKEHLTFVIALKISLADLSALVKKIGMGRDSRIFMVADDDRRLDFNELVDSNSVAAFPSDLGLDAALALQAENKPQRVRTAQGNWWVGARQSAATKTRTSIVLAVPERVLLERTELTFHSLLITYLLILGTLTAAVAYLSRRSGQALESLAQRPSHSSDSEEQIKDLIRTGENDVLEFKSTLRWNLKADRADKNIELACLKTIVAFMNTEGGTLLVGVTDEGTIAGIEADNFPNEDKFLLHFNNLVKEHIGLEFSDFISFGIKHIDGKAILVVDCTRASDPVFLRHGADEELYIRVGPGSRKLPASKILEYARTR